MKTIPPDPSGATFMTQPDPKHASAEAKTAQLDLAAIALTRPSPPTVTLLGIVLMIGLPSTIIGFPQRGNAIAWSATEERAPLPPPLTRTLNGKDSAITRPIIDERNGRPQVEVFGGATDLVGDGICPAVAGGSDYAHAGHDKPKLFKRLRSFCHRLKEHRSEHRAARQARLRHDPIFPRLRARLERH